MGIALRILTPILIASGLAFAALIPPIYLDTVVAIGHMEPAAEKTARWVTTGSGFLYGWLAQANADPAKRQYEVYLVTNRHVIADSAVVLFRMNTNNSAGKGRIFKVPAKDWFAHQDPTVDVAATRINWDVLVGQNIKTVFIPSDQMAATAEKMKEIGVTEGDRVFVLGFPMNLAGVERNYTIVRPGSIARVGDLLEAVNRYFLIDSHVFPGNSGGPVVLEPNDFHITNTKGNSRPFLIGMVKDFIPYRDVAISPQTKRARISFEENSGLSEVVPIDRIDEAIKAWRGSLPAAQQPPLKAAPETK